MNVLIIGSGGREHVLAWKIKQSPQVDQVFCAPGNGGMAQIAECVEIASDDIEGLLRFSQQKGIGLTVVGPEAPLVAGIVDAFTLKGLKVFGPSQAAAQLEGSKVFAKAFMQKYNIPTAEFKVFEDHQDATGFLEKTRFPVVIKADGLAAGKGVFVCNSLDEGKEALDQIMAQRVFKGAGNQVVIEECLVGEEASVLAVSDGLNYVILDTSQDHKRIFDEDQGPNTGGMGAYSPAPVVTKNILYDIDRKVIDSAIRGMSQEGSPFKGVLYAGLMITPEGPRVLEFNVRFGDPETQAVLPRMKDDLLDILLASCDGQLAGRTIEWDPRPCVCVVMSSGGYPGEYEKGKVIKGLEKFAAQKDTIVFHAGTKRQGEQILTSGGRVLGVTALGDDIEAAIEQAYIAVEQIRFDRCFFRRDIGARAVKGSQVTGAQGTG